MYFYEKTMSLITGDQWSPSTLFIYLFILYCNNTSTLPQIIGSTYQWHSLFNPALILRASWCTAGYAACIMSLLLSTPIATEFCCAVPTAISHWQAGFPEIASVTGIWCPPILGSLAPVSAVQCDVVWRSSQNPRQVPSALGSWALWGWRAWGVCTRTNKQWPLDAEVVQSGIENLCFILVWQTKPY